MTGRWRFHSFPPLPHSTAIRRRALDQSPNSRPWRFRTGSHSSGESATITGSLGGARTWAETDQPGQADPGLDRIH
jgi:hypothetical protein